MNGASCQLGHESNCHITPNAINTRREKGKKKKRYQKVHGTQNRANIFSECDQDHHKFN